MEFKEVSGVYFIGEHAESFVFYDKNKNIAYFKLLNDEGKIRIQPQECDYCKTDFGKGYIFENKSFLSFDFLRKKNEKMIIGVYAKAFADFLNKSKCSTPFLASFIFILSFTKKYNIQYDSTKLSTLSYSYDTNDRYSFLPSLMLYYTMCIRNDEASFDDSRITKLVQNLQEMVKILIFECENEIKTIDDKIASYFNPNSLKLKKGDQKFIFYIAYYLLTAKNISLTSVIKEKLDSPKLYQYFKFLVYRKNLNYLNCYMFPAIAWVIDPTKFMDKTIEYGFPAFVFKDLEDAYSIHAYFTKNMHKKLFFDNKSKYKKIIDNFVDILNKFLKNIPSDYKKNKSISIIHSFLSQVSKNLHQFANELNQYPYEKLPSYVTEINTFNDYISKLEYKDFWFKLDEDLPTANLKTAESIIDYVKKCINYY
ncbi:hypothetical protein M9Y10_028566 [Tritrichomonas musculus]|uniref:Uncharacterized protein n=1 Tax=Tritrichomonas musculus TaxID=1915356 RepID=A0ABR2KK84_9EUKA